MSNDHFQRRYARHIMLEGFGEGAQQKLASARVLVIGAGGLGSACISYLAAAGVGHIGIIDFDHVELSNLHRQILHEEGDLGRLKIESAADRVSELNSEIAVDVYAQRITEHNAHAIIARYDIIADGCDRFETRQLINATCWRAGKTLVSAAVIGYKGQLMSVNPRTDSPCYACLVPVRQQEPDRCSEVGVLGSVCGIIGSMQATEIIKQITGITDNLTGKWLRYDARTHALHIGTLTKDLHCTICKD